MTAGEITEAQPTNAAADEPFHFVADLIKHPADLPVLSHVCLKLRNRFVDS